MTPGEWLPILTAQLDSQATAIKPLRNYCDGNAPLPSMGPSLRKAWEAFQKKARVNYGGLACQALKNRIRPLGVSAGAGAANDAAIRIWRDNHLATQINLAVEDRLQVGIGYLVTGLGPDGNAVITREKPEFFTAATDPLQPWKAIAALKVWRDPVVKRDFALVWVEGQRQKFSRSSIANGVALKRAHAGENSVWDHEGDAETYDGRPPVVVLARPSGKALIEPHVDVIDAINLGKLQRLVTTAMQAFRQRGIKGDLPQTDEDGNDIDWAKVFEPAPGALWDLPEGIDVWESQYTDITPLLAGEQADRRDFAAVTMTPLSVFAPEGANQSAEGAANAKEGHVALAQDEVDDIAPAVAMAIVQALRAEEVDLTGVTVEVQFAPPALVSLSEKFAAAAGAKAAGISTKTIMREILGWSPEQIKAAQADAAAEALTAALGSSDFTTA